MRVIAGTYRGRTLQAPKGALTRPTTDRVRESLFSALASARGGFDGAWVLDCFAGTGALGVEALSRGAAYACFCERDRGALQALSVNTSFLEEGTYCVARIDVERVLPPTPVKPFDLLFFDPPYAWAEERVVGLLMRLEQAGIVAADALLAYEHSASAIPDFASVPYSLQWQCLSRRQFGETSLSLYRKESIVCEQ